MQSVLRKLTNFKIFSFRFCQLTRVTILRLSSPTSYVRLLVVGVANETEPVPVVFHQIENESRNVPIKLKSLELPSWFNADKFKRGQRYFYNNFYAMFVAKLCGLLLVLTIPTILKVLIQTGKSGTPAKAFRRYMDTISNMIDWYDGDLEKKDSNIYKILSTVRGKHCAAAKKYISDGTGFISQWDLLLTQFGFMGVAVSRRKFLGLNGSIQDLEGFIHFWRTIGYFMGIEDRFNICSGSVDHVTDICEKLSENIFKSHLRKPTEDFIRMSDALLIGLKPVVLFQDKDAFMEFTRRIVNLPAEQMNRTYAKCILSLLTFMHTTILNLRWVATIMRPILNALLRFSIYGNKTLPLVALLTMGREVLYDQTITEYGNHRHISMTMAH